MVLFGALFGSFANVVIWRVPRGESIAHPGSHCPSCGTPIAWYDNIPVLSWLLLLRARCRVCDAPIAVRYPAVELASAALFAVAAASFGVSGRAVVAAAVFWLLLVLAMIDIDHLRLPNPLVALLAALGLAAAAASQFAGVLLGPLTYQQGAVAGPGPLASALLGGVLGAGLSGAMAALYGLIRKKSGLGMGDVKLLGALGLVLGPYVLVSLFLGSLIGMVVGVAGSRSIRLSERRIPFGPWLAAGAVVTAVLGPALWEWYLHLVGLA
jgi:leader peptidase (prepilin peptidase)/N-methyltransferase